MARLNLFAGAVSMTSLTLAAALTSSLPLAQAAPPAGGPAGAAASKKAGAASAAVASLPADVAPRIRSEDPAVVKTALDDVRVAGKVGAPLAGEINGLLERGTTATLATAALDTVGELEVESSAAAVVPYLAHREPRVRQAAARALTHLRGAASVKGLRRALSDKDMKVRATAASGLGSIRAHEAVPDLMLALEHKVLEAAVSLGQLCAPAECDAFLAHLERQPFDVMSGGIDQMLFRPATEVNDDAKIKILGRLRELGTPDANRFLREAQKRWPKDSPARVKQALESAISATGGGL